MSEIDLRFTTIKQALPDFITTGLAVYAKDSNSYHYQPDELRQKLAEKHSVPVEMIYLTSGADQAIYLLTQAYGQRTHVFTPTYIGYSDVKKFGYELNEHYSLNGNNYSVDTNTIKDASLIILANPNNPAGLTKRDDVLSLVHNNQEAHVVIDEAYGDFATESIADSVPQNKNLTVIRSFSKSHLLAGFRIGYIIAHKEVINKIFFETTWFNIAYTSAGAANVALDNEMYFQDIREKTVLQRDITQQFLKEKGFTIVATNINAVVIKFDSTELAGEFTEKLKAVGILVNQGSGASNFGLDDSFVRISVGTEEHMNFLRSKL